VTEAAVFPLEDHARHALETLGEDEGFCLVSLIRLRRDLPDGQADHELQEYRRALKPITLDVGGRSLFASRVLLTFAGDPERWDVVLGTWLPNRAAWFASHRDPRIARAMVHRDQGFEDILSLLVKPHHPLVSP
jgi:hypothetical protein